MISVIIPAKDEELAIEDTIVQVSNILKDITHEIIVINDGSSDKTREVATKTGALVISHPHNLGYGASLKSGILKAKYDTIVITDADGTYPNDQIPMLIDAYNQGYDMVVGARNGEHYRESNLKAPMRAILKFLVEYTSGRRVPDVNSGLRVFSKKLIITYFNHLCNTFSFTTSLTLVYMMDSRFVSYMPVPYNKRVGQTKVKLFRDSLRTLQYIAEVITYYNPLKLFLLISIIIAVGFLLTLILYLILNINYFYMLSIGLALLSINTFCLGLIAILLKQIMNKK